VSSVLLVVATLLLAGCQTDAFLEVQVDEEGSGAVYVAVALDQEAATRSLLYETRAGNVLPTEDLTRAGWRITGPAQEQDGRTWIRAEKSFSQLDQLTEVVNEVAGADGPFRDFTVERVTTFGKKSWEFSGTVDLTRGLAGFSDDGVAAAFGGEPLGQPAKAFAAQLGTTLEQAVAVNVIVTLPGDLGANNGAVGSAGQAVATSSGAASTSTTGVVSAASSTAVRPPDNGAAVVWSPSFADPVPTGLQAVSSSSQLLPRIWRWVGVLAGGVGLLVLVYRLGQLLLDRRHDRRRGRGRGTDSADAPLRYDPVPMPLDPVPDLVVVPGGTPIQAVPTTGTVTSPRPVEDAGRVAPAQAAPPAASRNGGSGLGLIVIETSGALFVQRDAVEQVLVPFCRERNCALSVRQIGELYRQRLVGARPTAEFWAGLGLSGDPMLLDDALARRFDLSDHVITFLQQARRRGVTVVVVGDEVPEWTTVYRQRFKLDGLVASWVCSAEVGVRVPHPALIEAAQRLGGVAPSRAMVISAEPALLDTARRLGFRTVLYHPGAGDPDSDHAVLRTFAERGRPASSAVQG